MDSGIAAPFRGRRREMGTAVLTTFLYHHAPELSGRAGISPDRIAVCVGRFTPGGLDRVKGDGNYIDRLRHLRLQSLRYLHAGIATSEVPQNHCADVAVHLSLRLRILG